MLVLSRKTDDSIMIGEFIEVMVVEIRGDMVRLGIKAPSEVPVNRREVHEAMKRNGGSGRKHRAGLMRSPLPS